METRKLKNRDGVPALFWNRGVLPGKDVKVLTQPIPIRRSTVVPFKEAPVRLSSEWQKVIQEKNKGNRRAWKWLVGGQGDVIREKRNGLMLTLTVFSDNDMVVLESGVFGIGSRWVKCAGHDMTQPPPPASEILWQKVSVVRYYARTKSLVYSFTFTGGPVYVPVAAIPGSDFFYLPENAFVE
jgi:hypothetical protein